MLPSKPHDHQIIHHLINVIKEQAKLIDKLLQNQKHLIDQIRSFSNNEQYLSPSSPEFKKNPSQYPLSIPGNKPEFQNPNPKKMRNSTKKTNHFLNVLESQQFSSELSQEEEELFKEHSEPSDQSEYKESKIPQTKNVIKNFSKSLFRFIQKHRVYVSRVLDHLGIKQEEFQKVFQQFRGRIYTIVDLKKLWLEEEEGYGRAFRIISLEYLRKNSLNHIFNSRVKNHKTHIKYRKKMEQILKNPNEFNSIKYD